MTMTKFEQLRVSVSNHVYHGTSSKIEGELKVGKFDNILWTAFNPAVAQSYIAESGTTSLLRYPDFLDDCVQPESVWSEVAEMAGFSFETVKKGPHGIVLQWRWIDKTPTYGDLVHYIEHTLGYKVEGDYYNIKRSFKEEGGLIVHPANYKQEGELYFISLPETFRVFDMTNIDSDIHNPQYLDLATFERIQRQGYDAVIINDFTQSKKWGNVGHTSLGIFRRSLQHLFYFSIPAKNFDWDSDLTFQLTPEYIEWFVNQKK